MNQLIVLLFALIAASSAYVIRDEEGQEFLLVPLHRQRRDTTYDLSKGPNGGITASLGQKGTIYNNGVHRLDGAAGVSKQFHPSGPLSTGGQLEYSHIPSGSNLNLGAQHTGRGGGTDFGASGTANLWRSPNGNTRLDAVGRYDRHYGGQWGTQKPNYYGGLEFNHRF